METDELITKIVSWFILGIFVSAMAYTIYRDVVAQDEKCKRKMKAFKEMSASYEYIENDNGEFVKYNKHQTKEFLKHVEL